MVKFSVIFSSAALVDANPSNYLLDRETAVKIQLLEWQIGLANSTGIATSILTQTGNLEGRSSMANEHSLVRFKLLMGMMVWTHQSAGITYHTHVAGRHSTHITDEEMDAGLAFNPLITSNTENEAYAEYTMELYHGYGCHCLPDHAHYIFTGGSGRPQDSIDINCQLLRSCYACEEANHGGCDTHAEDYSYNLNRGTMLENAISCTDAVGSCARNVCECDKTFANNAAVLYTHDIWDDHHHGLDFNRSEMCKVHKGGNAPKRSHCDRKAAQTRLIEADLDTHHDSVSHDHEPNHSHGSHDHGHVTTNEPINVNSENINEHIEFDSHLIGHSQK